MRITQNPTLTGPFAALSPVAQTITPKPIANYAEEQQPTPRAPSQAPAAPQAGSILGLGLGQPTSAPSGSGGLGGLFDFSDPRVAIGWQMIANGARQPSEMFSGVPEAAFMAQRAQKEQMEEQRAAEQQNKTLEYLRANRPDLLPMAEAGYLKEAFAEAIKKPEVKREWVELDDGTYGWANETTGELEKLGTASKPTDYQQREQELIRRSIDPNSPSGQGYILTGKYAGPGGDVEGVGLKTELEASKAYRTEDDVKVYRDIRNAYQRVRASATLGNAQGDIGLVYGFMKMLDPTSVVREGEFATAQNSGGVEESVRNTYNKILSGERLTPEQRQQFAGAAEQYYNRAAENLAGTNQRYEPMLDQYGVPKERVIEQPMKFEPLKIGEAREVDVNGATVTIKKRGE